MKWPWGSKPEDEVPLPALQPFRAGLPTVVDALEYVYRLSSINGHTASVSSDGRFRAVIAIDDPGVPNWLDPAGYTEGGIYGRWYDCDSHPSRTWLHFVTLPWASGSHIFLSSATVTQSAQLFFGFTTTASPS